VYEVHNVAQCTNWSAAKWDCTDIAGTMAAMTGLVSGEGVAIELSHAGLGSRTVAGAIDFGVQLTALLLVFTLTAEFGSGDSATLAALALVEVVLILAGYPIVFEWLTRGRTLGKMAMGLRVVRDDGGPIGLRQAFVRGLAGFLIEKPGIVLGGLGTAIGMITMGTSRASKRIGDMMAGTFVLQERAGPSNALQPVDFWVPPALCGWAQSLDLSRVDDQFALSLRQFVVRAPQMLPAAQAALGDQFRAQLQAITAPPPPPGVPTPLLLTTVLAERRRRVTVAAPGGYVPPVQVGQWMPAPAGGSPAVEPVGPYRDDLTFTPPN
jgi:uncharacterized RDD family membrane protein YckC